MKTSDQIVDGIIHAYYNEHHNLNKYRRQLIEAIDIKTFIPFMDCKRRVVEAIDFRIKLLQGTLENLIKNPPKSRWLLDDTEARIDELETLRSFVKGMVTNA